MGPGGERGRTQGSEREIEEGEDGDHERSDEKKKKDPRLKCSTHNQPKNVLTISRLSGIACTSVPSGRGSQELGFDDFCQRNGPG